MTEQRNDRMAQQDVLRRRARQSQADDLLRMLALPPDNLAGPDNERLQICSDF